MPKALDLTNQEFGYLKALKKAQSRNNKTYWLCECKLCGKEKEIQTSHLMSGAIISCGCLKEQQPFTPKEQKCILCQENFISNNPNRKYCYSCSPEGMSAAQSQRLKKRAIKHFLLSQRGCKCERCGYDKCEGALQFHHKDPKLKEFNFSHINLNDSDFSMERLLSELDKCEVLCANCHFEEHYIKDNE